MGTKLLDLNKYIPLFYKCASAMAYPLSLIFRKSILEKKIPSALRLENICPIFKKGSRTEKANYRPISLTNIVCKILEAIIRDELMTFFMINNLIATEENGLIPRKGCVSNLLETLDFL